MTALPLHVAVHCVRAVVLLGLLATPAAAHHEPDPSAPWDFRNADPSSFGSAELPAYLEANEGGTQLAVPITLHPERLARPAFRYLVGFNLHNDAVRLTDLSLTLDGQPVPVERDETGRDLQPLYLVAGADLPRQGPVELLLTGTATASTDGRMHVGVLALAFDAGWGTVPTQDGDAGQAYAFTLLMSQGHAGTGLAPRFTGQGNSPLALAPLALLAAPTALGLRSAWRTLHPPAPRPATAAVVAPGPVPSPAPAPASAPAATPVPTPAPWPARPAQAAFPRPAVAHTHQAPPALARPARPAPRPLPEFTWAEPYVPPSHVAVKRPKRPAPPAPPAPALAAAQDALVSRPTVDFVVLKPARRGGQAARRR